MDEKPVLTEAEKQRLNADTEFLPPGIEFKPLNEVMADQEPGTFWDYCPNFLIGVIAIGLALSSLAVGYGLWKLVLNNNFIIG